MKHHLKEIIGAAVSLILTGGIVLLIGMARQFSCTTAPETFNHMRPTIEAGDSMTIRLDVQNLAALPVGTVVVYRLEGAGKDNMIGRVVAHPGQIVSTAPKGRYIVDGELLQTSAKSNSIGQVDDLIVPRDCVFVGFDSGLKVNLKDCIVPLHNIIGKPTKPL